MVDTIENDDESKLDDAECYEMWDAKMITLPLFLNPKQKRSDAQPGLPATSCLLVVDRRIRSRPPTSQSSLR